MDTYSDFQDKTVSEKIVLAKVSAKKRLMAWTQDTGSVYILENQDYEVIEKIEESGTAYTEVVNRGSMIPGTWFYERDLKTIYIWSTDSSNPNGKFFVGTFTYHFSNAALKLPNDLSTGYEVFWQPLITGTNKFGSELDNQDQIGSAIEGSGNITLSNDQTFWKSRYDRLTWENQTVKIYSWNRDLPITEAKLLFWGKINGKSWNLKTISFKLKDLLLELRNEVPLGNIEDISGALVPDNLKKAKQRRVYGAVEGHRPTNIDQVDTDAGYFLSGTLSVTSSVATVTGSGTNFFSQVSIDDNLVIEGVKYSVESVASDTSLTLTEAYGGATDSGLAYYIEPASPKTYTNRDWSVAGHAINEPLTTVNQGISQNRIKLFNSTDFFEGDDVYIGTLGSGEVAKINKVLGGGIITLTTNLATVPSFGTQVRRPAVQNVRINEHRLTYYSDYTVNAGAGTLTLTDTAEFNASRIRTLGTSLTWTNGSKSVTGAGLTKSLKPGMYIAKKAELVWYKIASIKDETEVLLTSNYAGATATVTSQYKSIPPFSEGEDVLTCKVYGTTDDDTETGVLLRTGPEIVEHMLTEIGLGNQLESTSFTTAKGIAPHLLGVVIPAAYNNNNSPKARDIIQKINESIFGSIIENDDFNLEYQVLQPQRPSSITTLKELDVLNFSLNTEMDRVSKKVALKYSAKEYDFSSKSNSELIYESNSNVGEYVTESKSTKEVETYITTADDARIFATRWNFLLEYGSSLLNITTKLKTSRLRVSDKIELEHEKLYDRIGGGQQKIAAINSIKQDGSEVEIELEDLGNAFTRIALITDASAPDYDNSTDNQKWINGFITDQYGLINNSEDTFGLNLIW